VIPLIAETIVRPSAERDARKRFTIEVRKVWQPYLRFIPSNVHHLVPSLQLYPCLYLYLSSSRICAHPSKKRGGKHRKYVGVRQDSVIAIENKARPLYTVYPSGSAFHDWLLLTMRKA
ncbi:unnamed protein product, partial [Scytosiphon promiscuus]